MIVVPAQMRRLNARSFLERLQRMETASRAELAKSLGMSQPTAGNIADDLLELGVLEETTVESAPAATRSRSASAAAIRLGRPGRLLRLNRTHPRFLGVQLGLLETDLALLPVSAPTKDEWVASYRTPGSTAAWLRSLSAAAQKLGVEQCWGVLVSVPGIVDEDSGRILFLAQPALDGESRPARDDSAAVEHPGDSGSGRARAGAWPPLVRPERP